MTAVEILKAARDRCLVETDWRALPCGASSALLRVGQTLPDWMLRRGPSYDQFQAACLCFKAAVGTDGVVAWSTDPARTHDEVLRAFDLAVAAAEMVG